MPQLSDSQLARLGSQITSRDSTIARLRDQVKSKNVQDNAIMLGTAVGAAGAFGYLRGKMEGSNGAWNVPGTQIDWEAVACVALGALAVGGGMISKDLKKLEAPAAHAAAGIAGHYVGQLARKFAKTGSFSLIAVHSPYLPPPGNAENSLSFRQTQMGAPFADPISVALSESGL